MTRMKAMVLAAGHGVRLRPLTQERAKPAIPLVGKPLILRIVEKFRRLGVDAFRINLHTLPETVMGLFDLQAGENSDVSFSYEKEILGTAGGLKANQSFFTEDTFLTVNGDIFFEFDVSQILNFHKQRCPLATLALYPQTHPYQHTPIQIDPDFRIHSFVKARQLLQKNKPAFVFTGVAILSNKIFELIPSDTFSDIVPDVYEPSLASGFEICGYPVKGYWNDLGAPSRYLATQRDILGCVHNSPFIFLDRTAINKSPKIGPYVSVGPRSIIEDGCEIQDSILWEDCHVLPGSRINHCIIGQGVTVQGDLEKKVITQNGVTTLE
ncbi:MAG: sugar phosphate nucleotidyltransferase [Desulfomonilaceae bacterium]